MMPTVRDFINEYGTDDVYLVFHTQKLYEVRFPCELTPDIIRRNCHAFDWMVRILYHIPFPFEHRTKMARALHEAWVKYNKICLEVFRQEGSWLNVAQMRRLSCVEAHIAHTRAFQKGLVYRTLTAQRDLSADPALAKLLRDHPCPTLEDESVYYAMAMRDLRSTSQQTASAQPAQPANEYRWPTASQASWSPFSSPAPPSSSPSQEDLPWPKRSTVKRPSESTGRIGKVTKVRTGVSHSASMTYPFSTIHISQTHPQYPDPEAP